MYFALLIVVMIVFFLTQTKIYKQKKSTDIVKESLLIMIHLDGGDDYDSGKSFIVKKGQNLYDYTDENGEKVLRNGCDYDLWQITSNQSEHAFEWIREDEYNNNISILNFWNGGTLSDTKKNISEGMAIDIIMRSNWIPGMTQLLPKNKNLAVNKLDKGKIKKKNTDKVITEDMKFSENKNSKAKGFGSLRSSTETNSRPKGFGSLRSSTETNNRTKGIGSLRSSTETNSRAEGQDKADPS